MIKKVLTTAVIFTCLFTMSFISIAEKNHVDSEQNCESEIVITSGKLSIENINLIKYRLENKDSQSLQGNILCIFGHDIETGTGEFTEHFYYSTTPKCRKSYFTYEICMRSGCDYSVQTVYRYETLYCH